MLIFAIILGVIGFILIFIAAIINEELSIDILLIIGLVLLPLGCIMIGSASGEKESYIRALKGHNPYKMEIRYELKDSIYVPVDTLYIINKRGDDSSASN